MNLNWSLKELYTSFECDEFKKDILKLKDMINEINDYSCELEKYSDIDNLESYIKKFTTFKDLSYKLSIYVNLSLSVNTKNTEALKYSDILDNELTEIVESETKIKRYISNIKNIDDLINKSGLLKEHEYILKEIVEESKYLLTNKEEKIIASMKNTGSNAWSKLKDNLISNLMVDIDKDGKKESLPLTVVLNMAYDDNEEIRKKAYEAEIASYKKVEEGVAAALNGIKG